MFWWKRPRSYIAPGEAILSPRNCCAAISPPVRSRQLPLSRPTICWACCWKNKETKQVPCRSTVLPCHWPGTSAWPSKRSRELPTEDGEIPPPPRAVPNNFPKLLPGSRLAHYNLCVAAELRPDPYVPDPWVTR